MQTSGHPVATATFDRANHLPSVQEVRHAADGSLLIAVPDGISAEFPAFAGVQTLGLQASAFLDFDTNTKYNRFYANLMMKGPIVSSLFYYKTRGGNS